MKVICAPDSFKESLTAVQAAAAMMAGVRRAVPQAEVDRCPVGDGGEGTLESLLDSLTGKSATAAASDVFGRRIEVEFGLLDAGRVAYIESAAAIGIATINPGKRDVMRSSSFGVGEIITDALERSPETIIVGVGGSASNDGGCGMAQALGIRFYDKDDRLIVKRISGSTLTKIHRIDAHDTVRQLQGTKIVVACDVENVLTGPQGAARTFAPQKGASDTDVVRLDDGLQHLAELLRRDLGIDIESVAGAGAAGGLGGGLVAFANAQMVSGIDTVLSAVNFAERVRDADLCLTGEGCLDAQSLSGKACMGVARIASTYGVKTIALVGRTGPGASQSLQAGIDEYVVIGEGLSDEESIQQAASLLTKAASAVTKKYC
jgi:glycerate kinase